MYFNIKNVNLIDWQSMIVDQPPMIMIVISDWRPQVGNYDNDQLTTMTDEVKDSSLGEKC